MQPNIPDATELPINILINKLTATAERSEGITLTPEETKLLAKEMGEFVYIPFYDFKNQG